VGQVLADPLCGTYAVTDAGKQALLQERTATMGLVLSGEAVGRLIAYQSLLEDWNARVNLTGDASFDAMLDKHLMDSLTPLTVDGLLPEGAAVIDVGSGAGLPGIPLAVLRPDLKITLLDSLQKRVKFLESAIGALGLPNVTAVHARAEDAAHDTRYRERFDIALARAVAALPVLLELLLPFVKTGGKSLAYKGPSVEDELVTGKRAAFLLGGGPPEAIGVSALALPEYRHCLVVNEKRFHTPGQYPRKAGTPGKSPLGI
jgi:16S rRNA (guanine527-N7)-methyltransferase